MEQTAAQCYCEKADHFIRFHVEIAIRAKPIKYVGQYTKEYRINQSASVHDEELIISYANPMNGAAKGIIPTVNMIHQSFLFFIDPYPFYKFSLIHPRVSIRKLKFGGESPLTMRAQCTTDRYCPDPLGIVPAEQFDKLYLTVNFYLLYHS